MDGIDPALVEQLETGGVLFVFAATFLSCLGLPIPAALVLLGAGAMIALGEQPPLPMFAAAYGAAALGGVLVFLLGRSGGPAIIDYLRRWPAFARLIDGAGDLIHRRGGMAVFLGASFVAQVGPAVALVTGAAKMAWRRFLGWYLVGRMIWVGVYMMLGFSLSDQIAYAVNLIGGFSRGLVYVLIAGALGALALRIYSRQNRKPN
ncbi:MAG: VTT domain-containing protein [Pseudomonadota bacterium]